MNKPSFDTFCNFMYSQYTKEKFQWNEIDVKNKDTYIFDNAAFLEQQYKTRMKAN